MALDWSKDISFSGLRKRKTQARAEYPSKTYINLAVRNKVEIDVRKTIPLAILLVLIVAAVCKFGIFDFLDRMSEKQSELAQQTRILSGLEAQLTDYDEVQAEYDLYEASKLAADDMTVSALDALALVDKYVRPRATIESIDLEGNTMSLSLSNITLDGVGKLVSTLYEQPIVANVSVSDAETDQRKNVDKTATMIITLKKERAPMPGESPQAAATPGQTGQAGQ